MDARETYIKAHLQPGALRPVLTSLNGDNSWLMSFPRPQSEQGPGQKAYFHIVFEPWLKGVTSMLSTWFIQIALPKTPAISNPEAIKNVIRQIEKHSRLREESELEDVIENHQGVDAILLGFHYLDHVHEPTLRMFDSQIPVIATPEAAKILQPWNHFENISLIHDLSAESKSWRTTGLHPGAALPSWITPIRLPGHYELNFVLSIVWTHQDSSNTEVHEALMLSPHGTRLDEGPLQAFLDAEPKTVKLALLHGLKESHAMGMQNTYGARGGLALYRRIGGAKYWIASHNSVLAYAGAFMRLLFVHDTARTIAWALGQEKQDKVQGEGQSEPTVLEVKDGECFVLS